MDEMSLVEWFQFDNHYWDLSAMDNPEIEAERGMFGYGGQSAISSQYRMEFLPNGDPQHDYETTMYVDDPALATYPHPGGKTVRTLVPASEIWIAEEPSES